MAQALPEPSSSDIASATSLVLCLVYQPQVAARTGATVGVEALVRWQHPVHGLLTPDAFVGLAESAGLMGLLTRDVLSKALGQCRQWALEGLPLRIAVNVSPSVLSDSTFSGDVARLLSAHVVDGSALTLEITEELLLSEHEAAVRSMERLAALGVRFSIDDYGTGYASLGYLDLPVAEIKLDRQFVSDMAGSSSTATIVRSTIDLAHALGLSVVAEGVGDQETLQLLADAGADEFQGYFLSKPVTDREVPSAARAASSKVSVIDDHVDVASEAIGVRVATPLVVGARNRAAHTIGGDVAPGAIATREPATVVTSVLHDG